MDRRDGMAWDGDGLEWDDMGLGWMIPWYGIG